MAQGDLTALNESPLWKEQKTDIQFKSYASAPTLANQLVPAEGQNALEAGGRAHRITFKNRESLAAGVANLDGGALPEASGSGYSEYYVGTYPLVASAGMTVQQEILGGSANVTVSPGAAVADMAEQGERFAALEGVFMHVDDTGILAGGTTGCSAANAGAGTMTFADAADLVRNYRLLVGMSVEVFDVTLATRRVAPDITKPTIVIANDSETGVVTLANLPAATVATDMLVIPGMIAPVPASGFHAGFATGTLNTSPGSLATPAQTTVTGPAAAFFGGQPWRKSLKYFTESDGAKYFFNLLRSSIPYQKPTGVAAGGAALNFTILSTLRDKLIQKTNQPYVASKYVGVTHHAQLTKLQATQVVSPISGMIQLTGSDQNLGVTKDPTPTSPMLNEAFYVMGMPIYMSPMWQPRHLSLFYEPNANLGRVWAPGGKPAKLSIGGQDTFVAYDAYGKPRTYFTRYMRSIGDLWAKDTSNFGEITGLAA